MTIALVILCWGAALFILGIGLGSATLIGAGVLAGVVAGVFAWDLMRGNSR